MPASKRASTDMAVRLQRMEDERAAIDRVYQYAHSIDYCPHERLLDCFMKDCSAESLQPWPTCEHTGSGDGHTSHPNRGEPIAYRHSADFSSGHREVQGGSHAHWIRGLVHQTPVPR